MGKAGKKASLQYDMLCMGVDVEYITVLHSLLISQAKKLESILRRRKMFLNSILNAIILGIVILIVNKGQHVPDISILLGLPIGLGVLGSILMLFFGFYSIVIIFGIALFALQWAFSLTTKQSVTVTGVWCAWQIVYTLI